MNEFRQILSVLLLLFTCACAPHITPTSSTSTSIITLNIVNNPTIVKTITPTATKKSTPTPTKTYIPTPSFTPTSTIQVAEKLCPSQRERAIIDIGLDMSTRLIFRDDTNSNLWSISADNPEPVSIPNIQPNGIIFYGISISPNNQWFAYYVFKEKKNSLAYYDIWVSSMDGLKQWQVLADNPGGFIIKWINENLIELWHYPDRSFTCPERIISVNPFTLETKIPETLPVNYDCLRGFILNPENTKAIIIDG